jgi:hypothetical protein
MRTQFLRRLDRMTAETSQTSQTLFHPAMLSA